MMVRAVGTHNVAVFLAAALQCLAIVTTTDTPIVTE
jgi:hypothetical protein